MKIVVVSESPCCPANAGNRIRTLNLMLPLAARHEITFLFRASANADENRQTREFLGDRGITPLIVDDPVTRPGRCNLTVKLATNLLSQAPYSVAAHNSPMVRRALRDHADGHDVDIWQFEWLAYADALPPQARKIVMAHDIMSLLWQRHHETATNPLKRWYIRRQWRKVEAFERRIFHKASAVVAVSEQDASLARKLYGLSTVDVVENGVDNDYFGEVEGQGDPRRILFMGSLESRPNLDAIEVLLGRIFPDVRRAVPDARLAIVGRGPPAWLVRRSSDLKNVEVHANVPDVRPFLAASGVLAVPLRIAGGSRIKILEALSAGLPVVSTRVGAEGLDLQPDREVVVVEDVEQMAAALIQCCREPARCQDRASRGQQVVRARYDWRSLAQRLERIWERTAARKPPASHERPMRRRSPSAPTAVAVGADRAAPDPLTIP